MKTVMGRICLFLLAVVLFAVFFTSYVYELRLPALGFDWNNTTGRVFRIHRGGPAEKAGLREGDVLIALGEARLTDRSVFLKEWEGAKVGETISLIIKREGQRRSLPLCPAAMAPFLGGYGVYYLMAFAFWSCGLLVYILRGGDRVTRIYLLFCLAATAAIFTNTNVNVSFKRWAGILQRLSIGLAAGLFLHLSFVFPEEKRLRGWRLFALAAFYLLALALGGVNAYLLPYQLQGHFTRLSDLLFLTLVLGFVVWVARLAYASFASSSLQVRGQSREMLVGFTLTLLPFMAMLVVDIAASRAIVDIRVLMASLVAFPMTSAYAVLRQSPSLNVDRLVNWGLVYTLLGVAAVVLYLLLAIALGKLFRVAISQALPVATASALLVVFLSLPIRRGLQALVDRLFCSS